jgi:hypothetical protein
METLESPICTFLTGLLDYRLETAFGCRPERLCYGTGTFAAELRFMATQRNGRLVMPAHFRSRIAHAAYEQAWLEFCRVPNLTPSERHNGAVRLRHYVKIMLDNGEYEPEKIAKQALDLTRAPDQTMRDRTQTAHVSKIGQAA